MTSNNQNKERNFFKKKNQINPTPWMPNIIIILLLIVLIYLSISMGNTINIVFYPTSDLFLILSKFHEIYFSKELCLHRGCIWIER